MFECDKCGCCCRHLDRSELYAGLDRGDGVCKYLSADLCTIYEDRPLLCRVDECYELYFSKILSKEEYYLLNKKACEFLRSI